MQMRVERGHVRLRTRKGLDWTGKFPEIAQAGTSLPDCLIDGEICAPNRHGISEFGLLQQALSERKTGVLIYFVFDCLFDGGRDLRAKPLEVRKKALHEILHQGSSKLLRYVPHLESSGSDVLAAACEMKLEGIVSKHVDAPYVSGRGDSWTKSKCRGGQEVVIGGWRGTKTQLRSLLVGTFKDGVLVYMGRVGTGFGSRLADDLLKRLNAIRSDASPFNERMRGKDFNWVKPELVGEIEFENITADGLFRQAAFKGLRLDKPASSVVRETPADAPGKRKPMKPRSSNGSSASVLGIAITHPDKALWPASSLGPAVTKLDLATYLESVAERMLPHVANRPISVVRAPDGIEGEHFFQRHELKGTAVPMLGIKVRGEKQPYLGIKDEKGLIALAQQAVLEIHPWGSKPGEPQSPERIIFDLDPAPDVSFARVVDAAKLLRKRLSALGFEPFVKTTGGKGLHVVVAIKGTPKEPVKWSDAKAFARAIAMIVAADDPDHFTTTVSKKARPGKIFIDYLRNDQTSTAVAPYSPRARTGATISVPLDWKDLNARLDPKTFTIHTAARLLGKRDPWRDLAASAVSLHAMLRKLKKSALGAAAV